MRFSKSKPTPSASQVGSWLTWSSGDIISKIEDGSIVACLSGLNRSGDLQHIFMPMMFDNAQNEHDIIGNMYDEKGEFGLLQIQGSEVGYGLVVEEFSNIPTDLRPSKPLPKKSLEGTPWADCSVDLGIVLCPLVVPFFFGQKIVHGNIFEDDFKLKMQAVSPEHGIWASLIAEAFEQFENRSTIETIIDRRLTKKSGESSISPGYDPEFISDSFPYCFITPFANRERAKEEQKAIVAFFKVRTVQPDVADPFAGDATDLPPVAQPTNQLQFQQQLQQQSQQWTQFLAIQQQTMIANQSQQPTQIIVESRADQAKEKEAKINSTMLRLFFVGGVTDFNSGNLVTTHAPTYTAAMSQILSEPSSVKYVLAINILRTTFEEEPNDVNERLSPFFTELSMRHFSRNFVAALINCNFQASNFETLDYDEPKAITVLHFARHEENRKLSEARVFEEEQRNERDFELIDGHRKQTKTTIAALGKVESMKDIGHIAANLAAVIRALFDIKSGAVPILYQLASKIIVTINQKNFKLWVEKFGYRMPYLPFIFLNMLQHVFGKMMVFASNTLNVQTLESGDDGSNLKSDIPRECVQHIARFFKKMEEYVADSSIPKDAPVWYSASSVEAPASVATATAPTIGTPHRSAVVAESSKSPSSSPAKKKSKGLKPTAKADQEKLGLFYAKEGSNINDHFPLGLEMDKQPCSFFTMKGKKCSKSRVECTRAHLAAWKDFGTDATRERNQAKILAHFKEKKIAWFCAETMTRHKATLPEEYQFLLGDSSGPKSM